MDRSMVDRRRFLREMSLLALGGLMGGPAVLAQTARGGRPYAPVRLFGADYVEIDDVAKRLGLSLGWVTPQKKARLKSAWTTIDVSSDSVETWINGLKVFLGEPVVSRNGTLFLGLRDAEQLLRPIISPGAVRPAPALRTVVIDPGHGGDDPGNRNTRLKLAEKTFTLDVAKRLERLLKAQGLRVVLTRTKDRGLELDDRTEIARKAGADLFISIHFNAFAESRVSGTETFILTPRHQRSSPQAERDTSMLATAYPGNKYDHWNALLGYQMHRQLVQQLKLEDRGLKRFRYRVLCMIDCPAVLVEAAFLSNDAEGRKVATAAYRQQIANAISAGVKANAATLASLRR